MNQVAYHVCSFIFIGLTCFLCNKNAPSFVPRTPHWRPSDPFFIENPAVTIKGL